MYYPTVAYFFKETVKLFKVYMFVFTLAPIMQAIKLLLQPFITAKLLLIKLMK
jgi:hypothetical protein